MRFKLIAPLVVVVCGAAIYAAYFYGPNAPCASGSEIDTSEAIRIAKDHAVGEVYFWRNAAGFQSGNELKAYFETSTNCCSAEKRYEWGSYYWVSSAAVKKDGREEAYTARITVCGRFIDAAW